MTIVAEITLRQPPKLHQLGIVIGQKAKVARNFRSPCPPDAERSLKGDDFAEHSEYITEKETQGCAAFKS
jgi:hypothetical protein